MKKTLFSVLALSAVVCSCTTGKKQTTLQGTLSDVKSDTILIYSSNPLAQGGEGSRVDTVALKDSKFTFTFSDTTLMRLQVVAKPSGNEAMMMPGPKSIIYIVPGDQLTLNGPVSGFTVTGNTFYETMNAQKQINAYDTKLEDVQKEAMSLYAKGELNDSIGMILQNKRAAIIDSLNQDQYAFIKANPNSDLSAYYLTFMPMTKVDSAFNIISEAVKTSAYAPMINLKMKQYEDYKAKEAAKAKLNPGMPAPGFSLPNLKGETVTLEQFRGKYVVLDFWGTWCGWCIKGLPEMKAYYEKYKSQMEIIGIDCRDKEDKWREGVAEYQIPWVNVYNGFDNKILNDYAIAGFPTKAVIDQQGNIVQIVVGESPEFYELLDKLMGKK